MRYLLLLDLVMRVVAALSLLIQSLLTRKAKALCERCKSEIPK